MKKEKIIFDIDSQGLNFKAWYIDEPKGEAYVEISREEKIVAEFYFPAYKIWNIAAHVDDIADDMIRGLQTASSTGFGGSVLPS